MNICCKKKILKQCLQGSLKSLECLNEWHGDRCKKLLQWVVYTNPSGHGNFARDLFVWEPHRNTSLPVPALKPTQWIAIVLTPYPAARVYTHWRRPSSSEITSSHYMAFYIVTGVPDVLDDRGRGKLHKDISDSLLKGFPNFSILFSQVTQFTAFLAWWEMVEDTQSKGWRREVNY